MKARSQSSWIRTKRSNSGEKPRAPGEKWDAKRALRELKILGERRNVEGMARFGIVAKNVYGVSKPKLVALACPIWRYSSLGAEALGTGNHGSRLPAGMVLGPRLASTASR